MPSVTQDRRIFGRSAQRLSALRARWFGFGVAFAVVPIAFAGIDPLSGIDFVRITHPGNAPWMGDGTPGDRAIGRGGVGYEYSIGRFEVTTAEWVDFFNAAYDRPADDRIPHLIPPDFWGAASTTPNTPGGRRWTVPAGNEMRPVGDISWRMAAIYCNWLCNGKSTDRAAFMNGAYDVSTFSYTGTVFNDQLTHNAGARYWIPTWDEWLKAAHYDPDKANGDGTTGGWWVYPDASDTPLVYGPPGVLVNGRPAQANAGWVTSEFPGHSPFAVPLGAYPEVQSPWGLFDVAGATTEWTEEYGAQQTARGFDGSAWIFGQGAIVDRITASGGDFPSLATFDLGFRIASAVPAPSASAMALGVLGLLTRRRTRTRPRDTA